ncbi:MAG: UbiH/UbiF family hydroxylase [Pseudomonadota bacterium]
MDADVIVVGAGPAGLSIAIALAQNGINVICTGPQAFCLHTDEDAHTSLDTRTTALFSGSVDYLKQIGVWQNCETIASPLKAIRIIDATSRFFRAPETLFHSCELNLPCFGYNISNQVLVQNLHSTLLETSGVTYIKTQAVHNICIEDDKVEITLNEGQRLQAAMIIGADGRKSLCRSAASIETLAWSYPQVALACNFSHSKSHDFISNEFHTSVGPFTTVPLGPNQSSLVWVNTPEQSHYLMALDEVQFQQKLESQLKGLLGQVTYTSKRSCFPLSSLTAKTFAKNKIALVGEAAHVMPPIGAQGLNLGFRDCAALVECFETAQIIDFSSSLPGILSAYNQKRRADVWSRTFAVDALNRSLLSGFLPLQAGRFIGLHLINKISPLKRFVMRQGMQPNWS